MVRPSPQINSALDKRRFPGSLGNEPVTPAVSIANIWNATQISSALDTTQFPPPE